MSRFMVYDEQGRIWPPGFKSQIHPDVPKHKGLEKALDAANAARAKGKGWGKGEIPHLTKPLLKDGAA